MNTLEKTIGRICEIQKNTFYIRYEGQELRAKLKGRFYLDGQEVPVVGDYVDFSYNPIGDSIINEILERKSVMVRSDFSGHIASMTKTVVEQVMIANVDYLFIAVSLNMDFSANRVARYASAALQGHMQPVVILTKADLVEDASKYVEEIRRISDKFQVHAISSVTGQGLSELQEYMKEGVTIALMGSSGVGKSTLLNTLFGKELMKTSGIREEDSKGRHTTTNRQLFEYNGVTIIDTPGMREFGMIDADEGINDTFEDIVELGRCCKFSNCSHEREPGCAIKAALEDGSLSEERYSLYLSLQAENMSTSAKKAKSMEHKMSIAMKKKNLKKTIY